MPLSFASVLGGVITLIGTSTNLVVSDLLRERTGQPLGLFETTSIGVIVAFVGVALISLLAPRMLGRRSSGVESMDESARRYTAAMEIDPRGPLVGRTVVEAGLRHLHGVFLAALERGGRVMTATPSTVLEGGDALYFVGDASEVIDLHAMRGLISAERPHVIGLGDRAGVGLFEAVVSERSELAGSTLKQTGFRGRHGAAVLAIHRADGDLPGKLGDIVLRAGDVLLVLAPPEFASQWRRSSDFALVAPLEEPPPPRTSRAWLVSAALAAMVMSVVTTLLPLLEASLLAASSMLVFGVISPVEARRAVNLNVVLTIALSISLGTAVEQSGLAAEAARLLGELGQRGGDTGVLAAVLVTTMLLTELVSNNAAAAVMVPIAFATAADHGLEPRPLAIAVLIGASCSFLSPIGYQTNLMVYGLGGYRFGDFVRLGTPLTLSTVAVTLVALPALIPLR